MSTTRQRVPSEGSVRGFRAELRVPLFPHKFRSDHHAALCKKKSVLNGGMHDYLSLNHHSDESNLLRLIAAVLSRRR